jgi:hypothetical protein
MWYLQDMHSKVMFFAGHVRKAAHAEEAGWNFELLQRARSSWIGLIGMNSQAY